MGWGRGVGERGRVGERGEREWVNESEWMRRVRERQRGEREGGVSEREWLRGSV